MSRAPKETYSPYLERIERLEFYKRFNSRRIGYIFIGVGLLGLQNQVIAFYHTLGARKRVFNKEWLEANLKEDHQLHMGADAPAPPYGYPDMGAGIYSRMLPYKEWFEFNCVQRVHQNNVEHLAWTLPLFALNGLFFPRATATLCGTVLVGRELYRTGYMSPEGPTSKVREMGAYPLNIAEALAVLSVCFIFLRYQFGGVVSRRKFVTFFTKSNYDVQFQKLTDKIKRGQDTKTVVTRTPGELSDAAKARENRLKHMLPTARFDR